MDVFGMPLFCLRMDTENYFSTVRKFLAEAQCFGASGLNRQCGEVEIVDNQQVLGVTQGRLLF